MSIENGHPHQLQLFAEEEAAARIAARAAAQAELDIRISRVGDTSHVATLDPELVELKAKNLENGSGFTQRMVDRTSQTPAEAGVNTAPRPPRVELPKRHLSARGQAFADRGRIPDHIRRQIPGYEDS